MAPRTTLRLPEPADATEYVALNRRSRRFHAGRVAPPRDLAAYRDLLQRNRDPQFCSWLIVRRDDAAILGAVELSQIVRGKFQSAYLGYHIGAPFAGQGYMREALASAISRAFRDLRLHRLEANIQPENTPSIRLVKQLGFRREGYSPRYLKIGGRWRDHERWAILAEEWGGRGIGAT
jgi:ribosomal-protein-alanine N-acetyltransferase